MSLETRRLPPTAARPIDLPTPHYGTAARRLVSMAVVAAAYVAAAAVGFRLAFAAEQITTVWAPTGIAIAALALGGLRLWPAVWLGALLANAGTSAPVWTALVIATGNTLEAVAAVWWLRAHHDLAFTFRRGADVLAFVLVAGIFCTAISATIGVTTLSLAGVQPWARFPVLWFDWWLGDALGALVVAPAILNAVTREWSKREALRTASWLAGSVAATHVVFGQVIGVSPHPIEYVVFPVAIGAAVTSGPAVTSWVVLSASVIAIWHTVNGVGPFASPEVHYSLVLLQAFMGILAGTSLLLAAAIAERVGIQQRERAAAEGLRQRQEMLRLAQRAGGVATFEWDLQQRTARCSAEFFAIFGLPAEDGVMTGAEWERFLHPDDRERMIEHLVGALTGAATPAADYRINTADGRTRWLSYAGQMQRTADGDRMLGIVVDITDRKRLEEQLRHHAVEVERILEARVDAESALRESQDVLTLAMRGGSMGAWSRDFATDEVWWSRELEELFGLQPGEFDRTEAGFFDFVHDEDRGGLRAAIDAAVRDGTDYVVEFRFRHATGEWRWMEGRGRAVYADDGTPRSLYGIGIDVTGRKRAEMALRDAIVAAESANQLKDQFLATLSHELRTPLNAILGYARLLQTNAIPPEKRQRAFEVIERNAVAQNQLVEDLLDMSRITTATIRLDPQPVPVARVVREAVDAVKPAADARGVALAVDLDLFAGTVRADPTRLQQVFGNVLTNAVKFTGEDGRVQVTLRRRDAHVTVVVSDTGAGIAPEFLPFVFEPFRQAEGHFDRTHGGLGLGLTITKQLVDLHGGSIRVESPGPGLGATFTIDLPRVEGAGAGDGAALPSPLGEPSRGLSMSPLSLDEVKILLVDDDPDTLTMFREALEGAGACVRAASNGADAIRAADGWQPDLLVTDLGLPGMDGYELLRAIRSAAVPVYPAVAVSAYARLEDRMQALSAGFRAHLAKPIDPAELVLAIRGVMSSPR